MQHSHAKVETYNTLVKHMNATLETDGAFMQQCLMIMHDDAHNQVLGNIWDVTIGLHYIVHRMTEGLTQLKYSLLGY
jgi:hypothetical protein